MNHTIHTSASRSDARLLLLFVMANKIGMVTIHDTMDLPCIRRRLPCPHQPRNRYRMQIYLPYHSTGLAIVFQVKQTINEKIILYSLHFEEHVSAL
jgi:hypothetical protein